jgi:hypothetical protein
MMMNTKETIMNLVTSFHITSPLYKTYETTEETTDVKEMHTLISE